MKKKILLITVLICSAYLLNAQTDTIYIMKAGTVISKFNTSDIDSIIFYNPGDGNRETVTDKSGNIYNVLVLGSQSWMAENLKTTKFNDGSNVPLVTDNSAWENLSTPGYCWYNNNVENKNTYGALYNWYTVQSDKLCPSGWHVPTDDDWKDLETTLGMVTSELDGSGWRGINEGSAMAGQADLWKNGVLEENAAFNESGFDGRPGGYRYFNGSFYVQTESGNWWCSDSSDENNAFYRGLSNTETKIRRYTDEKRMGFSVRCVKD